MYFMRASIFEIHHHYTFMIWLALQWYFEMAYFENTYLYSEMPILK